MFAAYIEISFFITVVFSSIIAWEFIVANAPTSTRVWGIIMAALLTFLAWPIMLTRLTSPRYIKEYVARCSKGAHQ
jgi:hypothetical protein